MKRSIMLLLVLALSVMLLSGCWDYSEVEHLSIAAGCAVDKSADGKLYHLTVEAFDTSGGKDSPMKSKLLEADGLTFLDAIRNIIKTSSEKLYWSNCQILIISKDIAMEGIEPILDFFIRSRELRPTIQVLISQEKTAKEIITPKSTSPSVASFDISTSLTVNPLSLSTTVSTQIIKIANVLAGEGSALTLPAIRNIVNDNVITNELNGVAIFDKDKLIGYLNPEDSRYFLFAKNEVKGGVLTGAIIPDPLGIISGEIIDTNTKIKPNYKNGELMISIKIKTTISLIEQGIGTRTDEKNFVETSAAYFERSLEENISRVIKMVQLTGQDIFGFGSVINQSNPKLWEGLKTNWSDTFKSLKTEVTSEVNIRDTGLLGS